MKAQPVEDELHPPTDQRDCEGRWARPLEFSGESSAGAGRRAAGRGPLADALELLHPARCVFLRTHDRVIDLLIKVGLLGREKHVNQPDHRSVCHPASCSHPALLCSGGEELSSCRVRHHEMATRQHLDLLNKVREFQCTRSNTCSSVRSLPQVHST